MTKIFKYSFMFLFLVALAKANREFTKIDSVMNDVRLSIYFYKKSENKYPKSWESLVQGGKMLQKDAKRADEELDFFRRYRLVEIDGVTLYGSPVKIIAMPGEAGNEGDRPNNEDPQLVSGRRLFIEEANGNMGVLRVSESILKKAFNDAGLDLAAYTWKPDESARSNLLETWEKINEDKTTGDIGANQHLEHPLDTLKTDRLPKDSSGKKTPGWWSAGLIALLLITAGLLKRRKQA